MLKGLSTRVQVRSTELRAPSCEPQKAPAQGGGGPPKVVKCYRCRKKDHMAPDCRVNFSNSRPAQLAPKQSSPKEKCERCWQTTHMMRNCRAGPPKKPCYCGGYWQLPMAPDSIPKTAFTCHLGLYECVPLPFGLTNAPAIFQ